MNYSVWDTLRINCDNSTVEQKKFWTPIKFYIGRTVKCKPQESDLQITDNQ